MVSVLFFGLDGDVFDQHWLDEGAIHDLLDH